MDKYYLGSNTYKGFFGFYDDALRDLEDVYLLKGGAGTGKSTLMKKILEEGEKRGYHCEGWYCSGDPKSLDGVLVKELKKAVVDATAPHAIEPKIPQAKESIVNLLDFVKRDKIKPRRNIIEKLVNDKKHSYTVGYEHLNIAFYHLRQIERIIGEGISKTEIQRFARGILPQLNQHEKCSKPECRNENRYLRAITPDGVKAFDINDKTHYLLKGEETTARLCVSFLIEELTPSVVLHNPLDGGKIDGFVFGDIAVLPQGYFGGNPSMVGEVIDLDRFERAVDKISLGLAKIKLQEEVDIAVDCFNTARSTHMEIESIYVPSMDFDGLNELTEKVINGFFTT